MFTHRKEGILKSLLMLLFTIGVLFTMIIMLTTLFKVITSNGKIVEYNIENTDYYEIEDGVELKPNLVLPEIKDRVKVYNLSENEMNVVFLNTENGLNIFKVVNCNNKVNCNSNLIIRANKTNIIFAPNVNYKMNAEISPDQKINIINIEEF